MIDHNKPEIVLTKRNAEKLLYKGYSYHKRKETSCNKYWRCTDRKCSSSVVTTLTNQILSLTEHKNHEPSFIKNEVLYSENFRKTRAITSRGQPRDIIDQSYMELSKECYFYMPTYKSMRNRISELRRRKDIKPADRFSDVPEIIKKTNHGECFYLYDSGEDDENRILVFSTASNIIHLENSKIRICDGTFRSCPSDFYQIYTIMGILNNQNFPLMYFLIKKKSVCSYLKGFSFLRNNIKKNPKLIIIDYEMASLSSLKQVFTESRVEGCFFHFSQIIYRKVQKTHLSILYKQNNDFKILIKMI
ncbi:hypothetical protein DMUE_0520, partial [Dictyocoela muelleri]